MKIYFETLGCKVNQYETAAMQTLFRKAGHAICERAADADVCVVNTCTVTASGDKKSLRALRRAKALNPDCVTVLCGCYAQAFPDEAAGIEDADIVLGTKERGAVVALTQRFINDKKRIVSLPAYQRGDGFVTLESEGMDGRTRAYIKIEDGCERFCAYCVIPYARGPVRSMPIADLSRQASALAAGGYREAVLTGINLCFYGREQRLTLADAVDAVAAQGIERVRLSSVEPDMLTEAMLVQMSKQKSLCPHFHMSIQSGCDATLARMGRRYTAADYAKTAKLIRELFDEPCFTTDIIVGFPGETADEFSQTLEFVRSFGFLKCHIFPYSRRSGTPAAAMPDQIPEAEKKRRARILADAAEATRAEVLASQTGKVHRVLAERRVADGCCDGFTERYIPALVEREGVSRGEIVTGTAVDVRDGTLIIK